MMIYLASTSPRRKKILGKLGVRYKTIVPAYTEKHGPNVSPASLVKKHAFGKAYSCVAKIKKGVIIGADTLVYCRKKIIGKPRDYRHARQVLTFLQGKWHMVYTGVALIGVEKGAIRKQECFCVRTKVLLKKLTPKQIEDYYRKINPSDKAGAYAIQSKINIVDRVQGSFSNAVGLPVEKLKSQLRRWQIVEA